MHDLIDSRDPQVPQRILQELEDRCLGVCLQDELRETKPYDVVNNGLDREASHWRLSQAQCGQTLPCYSCPQQPAP